MDTNRDIEFETDYRRWLVFSESVNNAKQLKNLENALNKRKSTNDISVKKKKDGSAYEYFIVENGKSSGLKISEENYIQFLNYFQEHYGRKKIENKPFTIDKQKSLKYSSNGFSKRNLGQKQMFISVQEEGVRIPFLLEKISSSNKLKHSFTFSLLALLVLQILIIPGNFGGFSFGDIGTYTFFGIMLLMWILSFWSYSKLFTMQNSYKEIFRLTASYFSILWLIAFSEIIIITVFEGRFNLWFSLFLLILGQISGLIISLFATMIMYFIKGGKVINVK